MPSPDKEFAARDRRSGRHRHRGSWWSKAVEHAARFDRRPDPDGDTKLAVDQPSLLFASYHNPDIETVGRRLDYLLALLITTMGGDLPAELRQTAS
jgi:hypothetical protein